MGDDVGHQKVYVGRTSDPEIVKLTALGPGITRFVTLFIALSVISVERAGCQGQCQENGGSSPDWTIPSFRTVAAVVCYLLGEHPLCPSSVLSLLRPIPFISRPALYAQGCFESVRGNVAPFCVQVPLAWFPLTVPLKVPLTDGT